VFVLSPTARFIVLDGNPKRRGLEKVVERVATWAKHHRVALWHPEPWSAIVRRSAIKKGTSLHGFRQPDELPGIKKNGIVVCLGGDGSLLHAARRYHAAGLSILGVNLGSVGFNTSITPRDLEPTLEAWAQGRTKAATRMMLEVARPRRQSGKPLRSVALNEVVLLREPSAHIIKIELCRENQTIFSCQADGVIVATPTGSTAYNLSAGGPIVDPAVDSFTVTLLDPHTLSARSIVLSPREPLELKWNARRGDPNPTLMLDGQERWPLQPEDQVGIRRSAKPLRLIQPPGEARRTYFELLRGKLNWNVSIRRRDYKG
jgi:NAD+ kinase